MKSDKAADNLRVIRQLMERPVRCSTQSGLSGILAGLVALAGLACDWLVCRRVGLGGRALLLNMGVWAAVFAVALAGSIGLTRLRELRSGMPFWTPAKRKILVTIAAPFAAGAGLTAAIVWRWYFRAGPNQFGLIPSVWMLFYGVACWQVGEYTIREIRAMGVAFILAGILTAAVWQYQFLPVDPTPGAAPYWTLGLTFGGFHIVYGIVVCCRHGG